MTKTNESVTGVYLRAIRFYRPYLGQIFLALLLLVVSIGFGLLKPWPVKWMIDTVLPVATAAKSGPVPDIVFWGIKMSVQHAILWASGGVVVIYLLSGIFSVWNNYILVEIGLKALLHLRTRLYAFLQHLPLHFHERRRSGDSTFRVAYDSQAIQTLFNRGFTTVLSSVVTLVGTFLVMFYVDWTLAVCSLLVVPLLWATIYFFARRIRQESDTLQQEESNVLAAATEGLSAIRVVHAFGREEYEVNQFAREAEHSYGANLRLTLTSTLSSLIVGLVTALGTALVLYLAVNHILQERFAIGNLFVFITYLANLYQPLEQLSYTAWSMEGAAAGMQRVFEVMDTEDTVPETPGAAPLPQIDGRITLENVSFGYEKDEELIVKGLSLDIHAGQTVAIVGGTGAGKTTVLSLIPRFYDPTEGRVLLDGHDIRQYRKKSVRENISIVLQDTLLLSGTVEENIAYGRLGAKPEEIRKAAVQAQAHDFIMRLPQGYQTHVGERGVRLSGGQRQRIGIARAFLKGAPILLLDEPTSALDVATESEVMETLKRLMRIQTTLIVTHRLNTVHHYADKIYVMDRGVLVEAGSGAELLARGGHYASLWAKGNYGG
ncbi:MAG TPA: ABC transporter ATP-binding protein [Candidatus Methylacidiphilales bacterium]